MGPLGQEYTICEGAQAVVDTKFMGSGIRNLMLDVLIKNMKGRDEFFFTTIAKTNPRALKLIIVTVGLWLMKKKIFSMFCERFKIVNVRQVNSCYKRNSNYNDDKL